MIIGIDLGTTNSLAAVWRNGVPELIPNVYGGHLTPSAVSVDKDGSILVGAAAHERLSVEPSRTAAAFKRAMGTDRVFRLARRSFRAEELSALVLKSLKADAERFLGTVVTEAVITVPAYFHDAQRRATQAAGQLAGLRVERLPNEPTAAALAYGLHERDGTEAAGERRIMVLDLGGGTFDVSILEMFDGVMEVRASAGDNYLGGEDFVDAIMDRFIPAVPARPPGSALQPQPVSRTRCTPWRCSATNGIGVKRDDVQAYEWFVLASRRYPSPHSHVTMVNRQAAELEVTLAPGDLARAKSEIGRWVPAPIRADLLPETL